MIRATRALPFAFALLAPGALLAQQGQYPSQESYGIRLEYREFRPTFDGDVRKGFGDDAGTLVDIVDDLGIEDDRTFEARGTLQFKAGHKLRGSYTPLDYRGDVESLPQDIEYGATRFQRFEHVASSFKGGFYTAAYEYDFLRGPKGFLGATLGAKMIDLDIAVASQDTGSRELDTLRVPLPSIGIVTRAYAGRVSVEGEFSGMTLGNQGTFLEFDASARVHLSDRLAASGGYRYLSVKAEDDLYFADLKIRGWHFGLEISL